MFSSGMSVLRVQHVRRRREDQEHVNRYGDSEQRQGQGHNQALLGEGAFHELTAVQFTNQAHITPCRKETYGDADRDKRRSKPEGELVGLNAGRVVRHVGLVRENPEMRHHKPECHQRDARANPGEKRSLFREVIPQISDRPSFDGGIHSANPTTDRIVDPFDAEARLRSSWIGRPGFEGRSSASPSDDWQARASSAIGEATREKRRAAHMLNVLGEPEMTWLLLLSPARFCV
jgi:hypothetical protein